MVNLLEYNHALKTVEPHFTELWEGRKTFELRKNDRDFKVGDRLFLRLYDGQTFGNKGLMAEVTHILSDFPDGLKEGYCILSIEPLFRVEANPVDDDDEEFC